MSSVAFRFGVAVVLTLSVVWVLVLAWWQSNDFQPTPQDFLLYLVALPLAFLGGFVLLRAFIDHLRKPLSVSAPRGEIEDKDPLLAGHQEKDGAQHSNVLLLGALVKTAAGESAEDSLVAVEAGQRPAPSGDLLGRDGYPVFSAQVAELDLDPVLSSLAALGPVAGRCSVDEEHAVRALSLLDQLLPDLFEQLSTVRIAPVKTRLLWLLPSDWSTGWLVTLEEWLKRRLSEEGWSDMPELMLRHVRDSAETMASLDQEMGYLHGRGDRQAISIVMSCISAIAPAVVDDWEGQGMLFSPAYPARRIPGEGAAILILATPSLANRPDQGELAVWLQQASRGQREERLSGPGRVRATLLRQLISEQFDRSGLTPAVCQSVLLDTDHRPAYLSEALEGIGELLPELDPILDCPALGATFGWLGCVAPLVLVGCAQARSHARGGAVLAVSNQHDFERAALLVHPFVPASCS